MTGIVRARRTPHRRKPQLWREDGGAAKVLLVILTLLTASIGGAGYWVYSDPARRQKFEQKLVDLGVIKPDKPGTANPPKEEPMPPEAAAAMARAETLLEKDDFDAAQDAAQKALVLLPKSLTPRAEDLLTKIRAGRRKALEARRVRDNAEREAKQARDRKRSKRDGKIEMAGVMIDAGDLKPAHNILKRLLKTHPGDPQALQLLLKVERGLNKRQERAERQKRALEAEQARQARAEADAKRRQKATEALRRREEAAARQRREEAETLRRREEVEALRRQAEAERKSRQERARLARLAEQKKHRADAVRIVRMALMEGRAHMAAQEWREALLAVGRARAVEPRVLKEEIDALDQLIVDTMLKAQANQIRNGKAKAEQVEIDRLLKELEAQKQALELLRKAVAEREKVQDDKSAAQVQIEQLKKELALMRDSQRSGRLDPEKIKELLDAQKKELLEQQKAAQEALQKAQAVAEKEAARRELERVRAELERAKAAQEKKQFDPQQLQDMMDARMKALLDQERAAREAEAKDRALAKKEVALRERTRMEMELRDSKAESERLRLQLQADRDAARKAELARLEREHKADLARLERERKEDLARLERERKAALEAQTRTAREADLARLERERQAALNVQTRTEREAAHKAELARLERERQAALNAQTRTAREAAHKEDLARLERERQAALNAQAPAAWQARVQDTLVRLDQSYGRSDAAQFESMLSAAYRRDHAAELDNAKRFFSLVKNLKSQRTLQPGSLRINGNRATALADWLLSYEIEGTQVSAKFRTRLKLVHESGEWKIDGWETLEGAP